MKKAHVVGVGVGFKKVKKRKTDTVSIAVLVEKKLPAYALNHKDVIPDQVESVPTDVQEIGIVEALTRNVRKRSEKWRPAPGGVSIGHYRVPSGTLGAAVTDRRTGEKLILSNNHVLAHSNDGRIGDPVLQPGSFDGGKKQDEIAELHRFVPLSFLVDTFVSERISGVIRVINWGFKIARSDHRLVAVRISEQENTVDAALALPLSEQAVEDEILTIGVLEGTGEAELGMHVEKSGRTTGHNTGVIDVVETTVVVHYDSYRSALFTHQAMVHMPSKGGDSGSVIVSGKKAVGLLFAGSENVSFCNPITAVVDALHIDV
jgi:hypothetical protein